MSALAVNAVRQVAGKKISEKINHNSSDPYYERVPVYGKDGSVIKYKLQERAPPPGLSEHDQQVLKRVQKKARRFDTCFSCCCGMVKFGWSSIFGLIPLIGDGIEWLIALRLIWIASTIDDGLPKRIRAQMVFNIALDFALGLVPVIGDIIDIYYRANTRNAWLLYEHLEKKGRANVNPDGGNSTDGSESGHGESRPNVILPKDPDVESGVETTWCRVDKGKEPVKPATVSTTPASRDRMPPVGRLLTPARCETGPRPGLKDPRAVTRSGRRS
ncbi:uncharacterized protein CTHT_0071050 [Thermochaetoides thermophila DSM 1495]|uniref:DUF4112 domain-containing protein n=1 Tax=Chaetomium thermophilum (strain DSM 1495 / CBS 144.50 / IMI 039719) TaxID=759272 RepID=G0SFJ4_CHATD|nr:hypothetical protein CTHT_0071050 [Thermochaetoides thermophila DSM 1495]EGS17759.1 hypothetical protein CTHT_0071050 [Thermochaetoides thermophila DSM 1495]